MNRTLNRFAVGAALFAFALSGCGGNASTAPDAQVSAAVRSSAHEMEPEADAGEVVPRFKALLTQLRDLPALAPLFDLYQVPNPIVMDDDDAATGLIELLHAVKVTLLNGTITITNRETGGVIFTAPRSDLASGELHPENLPGGTASPPAECTYTYSEWGACQPDGTQTRTVVSESPSGCTGTPVLSQPCTSTPPPPPPPVTTCTSFTYSAWGACQADSTQTRTVLSSSPAGCTGGTPVTSQACVYTPPVTTCTSFTYSAWGACQPDNTQSRTVLSSAPAGCTGGTPILTQACVYSPPPDGAALYGQYCAACHGALATSNLKGKSISVASIKSRNMTQGLNDGQLQAIVDVVGP